MGFRTQGAGVGLAGSAGGGWTTTLRCRRETRVGARRAVIRGTICWAKYVPKGIKCRDAAATGSRRDGERRVPGDAIGQAVGGILRSILASRGGVCKTGGAALSFHRTCSQFGLLPSIGGLSFTPGLSAEAFEPLQMPGSQAANGAVQRRGGTGFPSRQIASQPDETKQTIPCVSSMRAGSPRWPAWSTWMFTTREVTSSCPRVLWVLAQVPRGGKERRGTADGSLPGCVVAVQAHPCTRSRMPWLQRPNGDRDASPLSEAGAVSRLHWKLSAPGSYNETHSPWHA